MIESPLIQELVAEVRQDAILSILERRFHSVPGDVVEQLRTIEDEQKLKDLIAQAVDCPDLDAFRRQLQS